MLVITASSHLNLLLVFTPVFNQLMKSLVQRSTGALPWFPACAQSGLLVKALGEKKSHDAMMSAEVLSYFRLGRTLDGALVPETPLNAVHSEIHRQRSHIVQNAHFSSVRFATNKVPPAALELPEKINKVS